MVQMANQETALNTAHYAPQVNYNQSAKAPMPERREPNVDTKSDWAGAVADSLNNVSRAFASAAVATEKDNKEKAETAKYNSYALRFSQITEAQRQGRLTPFQADTEIRTVEQEGLIAGIPQDKLKAMREGYSGGITKLEEERQTFYNKKNWEAIDKQVQAFVTANPGLERLSRDKILALMNDVSLTLDNIGKLNQVIDSYEPGSPEYNTAKAQLAHLQQNDMRTKFMIHIGNMDDFNKDITESTIAEAKKVAIAYGRSLGMSDAEAGLMYDMTVRDLGITGAAGINKNIMEMSNAELKAGIENILSSTEYNIYRTVPGAAFSKVMNLRDAFNISLQASGIGRAYLTDVQNDLLTQLGYGWDPDKKEYTRAAQMTPVSAVPSLLGSVNNLNTSSQSSMNTKLTGSNYFLETVNSNFLPDPSDDSFTANRKFLNLQGITSRLNRAAIEKVADDASKSSDAGTAEGGRQLKARVNKMYTAEEYYNSIGKDTDLKTILNDPDIRKNLRYTEDGEIFYKDPETNDGLMMSFINSMIGNDADRAQLRAKWSDYTTRLLNEKGTLGYKVRELNKAVKEHVKDPKALYEMYKILPADALDKPYKFLKELDEPTSSDTKTVKAVKNTAEYYGNGGGYAEIGRAAQDIHNNVTQNDPAAEEKLRQEMSEAGFFKPQETTATATVSSSEPIAGASISYKEPKQSLKFSDINWSPDMEMYSEIMESIESGGKADAVSKKGARGLMQLMPDTYKDVAKRWNLPVDGINDPELNKIAGTLYLQEMLEKYNGDLEKAVAAYNWGPTALDKNIKKYGGSWRKHLPEETRNHVSKFLNKLYNGAW